MKVSQYQCERLWIRACPLALMIRRAGRVSASACVHLNHGGAWPSLNIKASILPKRRDDTLEKSKEVPCIRMRV